MNSISFAFKFILKRNFFFKLLGSVAATSIITLPSSAKPATYVLTGFDAVSGNSLEGFVTIDRSNAVDDRGFNAAIGDNFIQKIVFPSLGYDSSDDNGTYVFGSDLINVEDIDWKADIIPQLRADGESFESDFNIFTSICNGFNYYEARCDGIDYEWISLLLQQLNIEPISELDFGAGYGYATYLSQSLEFLNNSVRQVRSLIGKGEELGWKMLESENSSVSITGLSEVSGGTLNGSYYNVGSVNNNVAIEYKINDAWSVGAAYGYGTNWMDGKNDFNDASNINSEVHTGSIYGQHIAGNDIKIQALLSYSGIENEGERYFDNEKNTSDYGGSGYSFSIAALKDFFLGFNHNNQSQPHALKVTPLLGFTGNFYNQDGFTEDDKVITAKSKSVSSLMGEVGVEVAALIPIGANSFASPRLNASYEQNFAAGGSNSELSLYDDITSVTTDGISYGNSRGRFGVGVDFSIDDHFIISLNGGYTTFGSGDSYSYGGGVTYKF